MNKGKLLQLGAIYTAVRLVLPLLIIPAIRILWNSKELGYVKQIVLNAVREVVSTIL